MDCINCQHNPRTWGLPDNENGKGIICIYLNHCNFNKESRKLYRKELDNLDAANNYYQQEVKRTMSFTGTFNEQISHVCMGIAGETGELVEYMKKCLYTGGNLDEKKLMEEMGDVLWYLVALCNFYGVNLEDVMRFNIEKLRKRYPNGFNIKDCQERKQ